MKKKKKLIPILMVLVLLSGCLLLYSLLTYNSDIKIVRVADSSKVSAKLKDALVGSGSIELTEAETNSLIDMALKMDSSLKDRVKDAYIRIQEGRVQLNALVNVIGMDLFLQSEVVPAMMDGSINLKVEQVKVGKITLPDSIKNALLEKYFPAGTKFLSNGSLDIGSSLLIFDVSGIEVTEDYVKLALKLEPAEDVKVADNKEAAKASPSEGDKTTHTKPAEDQRVTMLKKTNTQLYNVKNAVKDQKGKDWVSLVISVNSSMMQNPDEDFSSQINNAKAVYGSFPEEVRDDIKMAALNNLDITAVRYLVNTYGI